MFGGVCYTNPKGLHLAAPGWLQYHFLFLLGGLLLCLPLVLAFPPALLLSLFFSLFFFLSFSRCRATEMTGKAMEVRGIDRHEATRKGVVVPLGVGITYEMANSPR